MCSSPKSSGQGFRQSKKREFSYAEYKAQGSMMRRASAVYDQIERKKFADQALKSNR